MGRNKKPEESPEARKLREYIECMEKEAEQFSEFYRKVCLNHNPIGGEGLEQLVAHYGVKRRRWWKFSEPDFIFRQRAHRIIVKHMHDKCFGEIHFG